MSVLRCAIGKKAAMGLASLLALTLLTPLWAQVTTSRLDGTVKDPSGGVVSGADVQITNIDTNVQDTKVSNESGLYVFPQVTPGHYRITAQMSGFKTAVVDKVKVDVNIPATVDLTLEVGQLSEIVQITAEAGTPINTVNAQISTVVERAQIESLPLNGRDPVELALLQAGVTGRGAIAREASVNGLRGTFNNFTLDGVNNQDNFIRTDSFFGVLPLRESFVEEFNLTTSNSDVDAGLGASQLKLITRSGTNEYHGSAFYFHRNSALNANTFFNNASGAPKERVLNHQFGGNLGGPVIKDKLFFFGNYEEERDQSNVSVVRDVLTASARQGIFSYIRSDNGAVQTVNLLQLASVPLDSAINQLLALTPAANDTSRGDGRNTSGFRFNSPATSESRWVDAKVDYIPTARHAFSAVFHQFQFELPNDPFNDIDSVFPGLPGGGQESTRRLGSASWRSNIRPNLTNEARWGFQYAPVKFFTDESFASGYQLDIPLIDNPIRNDLAQGRNAPVYELTDEAHWLKGNHSIKFGGAFRWSSVDLFTDAGILPLYTVDFGTGTEDPLFAGLFPGGISSNDLGTASALLSLLGGFVEEAEQTFNVTSRTSGFVDRAGERRVFKQQFFSLFGSDTWKVNPSLSVNFGLRWEYHTVPDEESGLALLPVGGINAVLNPNATLDFAGGDTGRPFHNKDLNNFAPSVGVAWRPFSGRSSVIRAGYSIAYVNDNNFTAVRNALIGNDGLQQAVALPGVGGTVSQGGVVPVPEPEFKVPRTARDNILLDSTAALFTIDPELRTPYVQQWNLSFQHEIFKDTAIEVRYVGNRGVKLARAVDINQVSFPAAFVEDFRRAQRNLAATGDPRRGEPLQVFPQLGLGGFLQDGTVRTWIRNGEIGNYVGDFLAPNRTFFFAGEGGEDFGAQLPISYFYANPNAFVGDFLGNLSYSKYHSLQMEIRRRVSDDLSFQANYTYGKVLTDYAGSQQNFLALMDNAQPQLENMRADFDITHTFNTNFVYQLPFGANRRFLSGSAVLDKFVGGWELSSIIRVHSGEVINLISQRGTINRFGRSGKNSVNLVGLTIPELQDKTGVYRDSRGRMVMFDPSLIGADGRANTQFFQNPGLLQAGTLGLSPISGPWYFNTDLRVTKRTPLPISESTAIEFVADFFNLFNRANFNIAGSGTDPNGLFNAQSINSTSFGLIRSTFDARTIQFGLKLLF